jgi:acetylxylan esterase
MTRTLRSLLLVLASLLGIVAPARAASLQQVNNWGASGVPSYVAMYIYVPDKLAMNPPILVVSHYCTGDAAAMFSQAKTSGVAAASDQYGFIMVFPQNHLPGTTRNCWDVGSTASLTRDGGGDTQAIAQMVKYTVTQYKANPNRVYATGSSSGAMMTQALLALYPDLFKGGAEFSGVPAGCWADGYRSSDQWSDNCAGGKTSFTAAQWGDKVRAMDPGFTGLRPRVQLWHGDADETINPNNFAEAIKEWTNVLGLTTAPTSTSTVRLSGKSWTRQSWQSTCGVTVLDAWLEKGGIHNIDANLNAQYIIPFFGLDKSGDVDPEVAACSGDAGIAGTGGAGGAGGTGAGGGKDAGASDGGGSTGGESTGGQGASGSGGGTVVDAGGSGGSGDAGGDKDGGSADASETGGSPSSGGSQCSGGKLGTGGVTASGGSVGTGGAASGTGGASASGGTTGSGGSMDASAPSATGSGAGGCACALADGARGSPTGATVALMALAIASGLTRRRPRKN